MTNICLKTLGLGVYQDVLMLLMCWTGNVFEAFIAH